MAACDYSFALSDDDAALRLAGVAGPLRAGERGGDPGAAPRGRRASPASHTTQGGLGGPGDIRRTEPAVAERAARSPLGRPRHVARLASSTGRPALALPEPAWQAAGVGADPRVGDPARETEPAMGIPADPGRAHASGAPGWSGHDPADPVSGRARPGATTRQQHLAGVPAQSSFGAAGLRFLPRRHRAAAPHSQCSS